MHQQYRHELPLLPPLLAALWTVCAMLLGYDRYSERLQQARNLGSVYPPL